MELKNYFVQNANGDILPGATAALVNGSAVSIRAQERTYNKHTELRLGRNQFSGSLWGHLRSIRYFPRRLTNAELQALTA